MQEKQDLSLSISNKKSRSYSLENQKNNNFIDINLNSEERRVSHQQEFDVFLNKNLQYK